jgi:hypothetical protein
VPLGWKTTCALAFSANDRMRPRTVTVTEGSPSWQLHCTTGGSVSPSHSPSTLVRVSMEKLSSTRSRVSRIRLRVSCDTV